jgi:predicted transcriptional regulator
MLPALQTIKKALLTVDLEILIEDLKNVIAIAPEGPVLLVSKQKLTDSETLTLHLLAAYVGNKLGKSKNILSKEELQAGLGKSAKITSTRIGELIREGLATKTEEGNYKITTLGIKRFQEESLPEIREKLQR